MPKEQEPAPTVEVDLPVEKKGVSKFNFNQIGNPAPAKWKRIGAAIRYTLTGMITMVAGSDLFTGYQSKVICFGLGLCILISGGVEVFMGVEPPEKK